MQDVEIVSPMVNMKTVFVDQKSNLEPLPTQDSLGPVNFLCFGAPLALQNTG